ncbi:hypothetical protein BC832DRAFT_122634 [Gaertneriomyces semiglobifer]|nr:hypothetical protein BC832DRAFT_122634 [Gaertneriomyces semiglobifer]
MKGTDSPYIDLDITCNILVTQHGVAEALLSLLRLEVTRVQQGGGELKSTVKVLHAAVGALKNLSLAVANRQILGSMGVIPAVAELLELQGVKPVQQGGIGILKNLCAGDNAANIYRTITGLSPPSDGTLATWPAPSPTDKTPLRSIISLIWNATGDNDTGIRYEGGRLISHLVRGCVSSSALIRSLIDANIVPPLVQIVTGALLTKVRSDVSDDSDELSEDEHHVHFDALPTSRVFPQVQNEGVVALVMLCKVCPDVVGRVARYEALVGALTSILASGLAVEGVVEKKEEAGEGDQFVYPEEVKCNVGVLVRELCGDGEFHASNTNFRFCFACLVTHSIFISRRIISSSDSSNAHQKHSSATSSNPTSDTDTDAR